MNNLPKQQDAPATTPGAMGEAPFSDAVRRYFTQMHSLVPMFDQGEDDAWVPLEDARLIETKFYTAIAENAALTQQLADARGKRERFITRITNYLASGGLFNPEAMEHDKVSALLRDVLEYLRTK
jgi:hypothetical protein